jgi:hypothetical protein
VNLAVEMKLLVSRETKCWVGGHRNRQQILDYYDAFPNIPKFRNIGTDIFEMKPIKTVREAKSKGRSKVMVHSDFTRLENITQTTASG